MPMFKLNKAKKYDGDLHRIVDDIVVLDNDGLFDLLSIGRNSMRQCVVTSLLDDDVAKGVAKYFSVVVTTRQYSDFLHRKLTLLSLLEKSSMLFLFDKKSTGEELLVVHASLSDIPENYRPKEWAVSPEVQLTPTLEYNTRMYGGLADKGMASEEGFDVFADQIRESLKKPYHKLMAPLYPAYSMNVNYGTFATGSFKVGFVVELKPKEKKKGTKEKLQTAMFQDPTQVEGALSALYNLVLTDLSNERGIDVDSPRFRKLRTAIEESYRANARTIPKDLDESIISAVKETLVTFSEIEIGRDFSGVEISNRSATGADVPIGIVDREFLDSISGLAESFNAEVAPDEVVDPYPASYQIHVFAFNKESGNGAAYLHTWDSSGEKIAVKVKIHARGLQSYEHSELSGSLDNGKIISKEGIAKSIDGVVKSIRFDLKPSSK